MWQKERVKWQDYLEKNNPEMLAEMKEQSEQEAMEAFAGKMAFGTGGLRSVLGVGPARMNIYTVARATQGIAEYLKENKENPSVIIGYDCRIKSDLFATTTACIFTANGIHVYLYEELKPVPMVSFGVRALSCDGGVMITASHNPAKYNGYKLYGDDGCQIGAEVADKVLAKIATIDYFGGGFLHLIGAQMRQQIGNTEHRIRCILTHRYRHGRTVTADHRTVQCQRNSRPLIFFDTTVIVRIKIRKPAILIQRIGFEIQTR
jgi:hypothetical protein